MTPVQTDEELDQMLMKAQPYIDDDGFTSKVLGALPPRRSAGRARSAVLVGSAIAALAALAFGPARTLWADSLAALAAGTFSWPLAVLAVLTVAVVCTTALSALVREAEG
ncbi:MAG: hypothetical protein ACYC8T_33675 [Myxococcaceae bacterium]